MIKIQDRVNVAFLIRQVLISRMCVREAVLNFPRDTDDKSIQAAYHALVHAAQLRQHTALHVLSLPQLPQPLGKYLIPRHHLPPSSGFFFIACNSIRASVSLM